MAAENVGAVAEIADVAGGEQQDAAGADIGRPGRELGLAHGPDQAGRLLLGEYLGNALELCFRNAGDALGFIRRPLLDLLAHLLHAVHALLNEFLVLPAVLEDVPEHPVDRWNVSAGPHPHIFGGVRGGTRQARIDGDEVRAVELLAFKQVLQGDRMRFRGIAAHDHERLGVADVVVAVGHRTVAPGIGHAGDRRRMTDARLVIDVIGPPVRREFPEQIGALVGELGGPEPIDRVGAGLAANGDELVADLIDRLLPAQPGPLAVHELHRIFQAPVAVHQLAHRCALGAVRAAVEGGVPAGLLPDPYAVRDLGHDRAADRAVGADVLADGDLRARGRRRAGLRLAHGSERQHAERGEPTADEARPAQESTAIKTAVGWTLHRGKSAAAGLALRSLDQHGRLPQLG